MQRRKKGRREENENYMNIESADKATEMLNHI